jgi:hypothetical protein
MHLPIIDLTIPRDSDSEFAPIYDGMIAEGWDDLVPERVRVSIEPAGRAGGGS